MFICDNKSQHLLFYFVFLGLSGIIIFQKYFGLQDMQEDMFVDVVASLEVEAKYFQPFGLVLLGGRKNYRLEIINFGLQRLNILFPAYFSKVL